MGTASIRYLSSSNHCYLGYDTGKDPYSPYVVLLLNMEGTLGASTFTDESYTPRAITNSGAVAYSAASKPFGAMSAEFTGAATSNLFCGGSGFREFINSNFTIEFMANFTSLTSEPQICGQYIAGVGTSWSFRVSTAGVRFYWSINGTTLTSVLFATAIPLGVWHSIALVKDGTTLRCYLNGSPIGAGQTTSNNIVLSTANVYIGTSTVGTANRLTGYLKALRITTMARYTNCAVIPADLYEAVTTTNPYNYFTSTDGDSHWDGNLLQLHLDGYDGSKTILDSSSYGRVPAPLDESVGLSAAQSKFGTTCLSFNGSSSSNSVVKYLDLFRLSSRSFTIEFWIYPLLDNVTTGETLFCLGPTDEVSESGINIVRGADNRIDYYIGGTAANYSHTAHGTLVPANQWSHIALTAGVGASNTTWLLFVNGVWQANPHANYTIPPMSIFLGRRSELVPGGPIGFTGYMDEFNLTKGDIRYTTTFTPPTKPFKDARVRDPYFNNVLLLVNGEEGGTGPFGDKGPAQRSPLSTNSMSINTTSPTYGLGALAGTGTGGFYLVFEAGLDFNLSPSGVLANDQDFTIECWVRHTTAVSPVGWMSRQNATGSTGWYLATNATGRPTFVANVGSGMQTLLTAPSALLANMNYHLAVTRAGNILRLYVDGDPVASYTLTTPFVDASGEALLVGANYEAGGSVLDTSKIIEEVRFTQGVSRYKGSGGFTARCAPFPTS